MSGESWQSNLLDRPTDIASLLGRVRSIAVLGIKTEAQSGQPAYYVPQYLVDAGFEVYPVPVYYPQVLAILGQPVYRRVSDIPKRVDLVNIFRRPEDVPGHLEDLLSARPKAVWMQSGIRNDAVAEALCRAGIEVVQDRCLMVEHRRLLPRG